jgi:HEAT repeat protein
MQASPEVLREVARQGILWDLSPFFAYLERLGPSALALAGELYESFGEPSFRTEAEAFFARIGRRDPACLAGLADAKKPELARTIISVLAGQSDRRVLPHLIVFSTHPSSSVRRAVVQAVRAFPGREAGRALAGFLDDPDGTLRIEAAIALRVGADPDSAPALLRIAGSSEFRDRGPEEIAAFLEALGATKTREALVFLSRPIAKRRWRTGEKDFILALAAVRGLERMGTPAAKTALEAGARRRHRRLRAACRAALARLSGEPGPGRGSA